MSCFLKTPNLYGFSNISFKLKNNINSSINYLYTGKMDLIHLGGAINHITDEYIISNVFHQIDFNLNYNQYLNNMGVKLRYLFGIKNVTNSYQSNFNILKNRDSNFIYGPSTPRMIIFGLSVSSL